MIFTEDAASIIRSYFKNGLLNWHETWLVYSRFYADQVDIKFGVIWNKSVFFKEQIQLQKVDPSWPLTRQTLFFSRSTRIRASVPEFKPDRTKPPKSFEFENMEGGGVALFQQTVASFNCCVRSTWSETDWTIKIVWILLKLHSSYSHLNIAYNACKVYGERFSDVRPQDLLDLDVNFDLLDIIWRRFTCCMMIYVWMQSVFVWKYYIGPFLGLFR